MTGHPDSSLPERRTAMRRVAAFLAFLAVATVAASVAASHLKAGPLPSLLVMWSPGIAALLASLVMRRSIAEIGWRPWPVKWLGAGWLFPILVALPAYGIVWLLGLGSVPNPTFLERARLTLGMATGPDWLLIVAAFGFITIVNLLPNLVLSLGEEIGWRGYLVPELSKGIGFRRASLASGAIWAAWHLPGVLSGGYGAAGTPLAYRLACFTAMVVASGVTLAWLRMKSRSIWPAAIMHATHNGIVQAFLDRITADSGHTAWFTGEFGIALVPFTVALAWYCWRRADDLETSGVASRPVVEARAVMAKAG